MVRVWRPVLCRCRLDPKKAHFLLCRLHNTYDNELWSNTNHRINRLHLMTMSPTETSYRELAGIPLHYARPPVGAYGSRGKQRTFSSTAELRDTFEACLKELSNACPMGKPEVLTTAGFFVNKPGQHGVGKAVDIDGIFWKDRDFVTDFYPTDKVFYLAVESVLRRHFGIVLNYLYNTDHHDHFHIDISSPVDFFPSSRSRVLYLQASLTHIHDTAVIIDGIWGNQTETATKQVLESLDLSGDITHATTWKSYLSKTAEAGFELAVPSHLRNPAHLLDDVYEAMHDLVPDVSARKKLVGSLDVFAAHPKTSEWLKELRS